MDSGASDATAFLLTMCMCHMVIMAVFGFIGYYMGKDKTIGPVAGALLGAFLTWVGLIIVAVVPNRPMRRPRRRGPIGRPRGGSRRRGARDDFPAAPMAPEPEPVFELRFSCPKCGKKFAIQDPAKAGTKAKCADCSTIFLIPEPPK